MVSITKKVNKLQIVTFLIPFALSFFVAARQSILLLSLCIISMFVIVGIVPLFKRRENLWMFLLVGITGIPINLWFAYQFMATGYFDDGFIASRIVLTLLLYFVLFSIEELALGILTRIIWPKQYKIAL